MMENIRTAANSIIVKIIFAIIILAFIFTGVGSLFGISGNSANDERLYIAKIDGEGISRAAFEADAQYALQNAGSLGKGIDASFEHAIRQSVLANQVDNFLFFQFAKSLGTQISDDQVKSFIQKQPVFFENGKFSNSLYLQLLASNQYTPDSYAEQIRTVLQRQQAISALADSEFTLPLDLELVNLENQKRTIYTGDVSLDNVIDRDSVHVTDEQALEYYNNNQNLFTKKERVKLQYIRLSLANFEQALSLKDISDDEATQYYHANKDNYYTPLRHSYQFIQLDDKEQAEKLLKELNKGANFADKAKQYSLNSELLDMGWFTMDDKASLPKIITDANLNEKGKLSLVEDQGHYIILKLDNVEQKKLYPLQSIIGKIKQDIWRKKVDENYQNALANLQKSLDKGLTSVKEIAEDSGLQDQLVDSDWSYYKEASSIVRIPQIRDIVFDGTMFNENGSTGKVTDIIYSDYDHADYVLQVIDYRPEGISSFDEEKVAIINKLSKDERVRLFTNKVKSMTDSFNNGVRDDKVMFDQKLVLGRTSVDNENDQGLIDQVFSMVPLPKGKSGMLYSSYLPTETSARFVVLVDVQNPDVVDSQEQTQALEVIKNVSQQNLANSLSNTLRSNAKIEIMPNSNL